MKNFASTTGGQVTLFAAAMSVICAVFVPYGYPWLSLGCALLACAAAVSMAKRLITTSPSMNDVINDVEAEPAATAVAPGQRVVS
jgi:hypothetical protein